MTDLQCKCNKLTKKKTHSLSPCKMKSPQDHIQGELGYESIHTSYLKRT